MPALLSPDAIGAASPKPTSPGIPITEWDESAVNTYFVSLGLAKYKDVIYEHGITGEVLCALDNETLLDLGMSSLGHRLNVLRNVFELKKEQGIEIGEDDWRPQEEVTLEAMETAATIGRMWNLVLDQQNRLQHLEAEHKHLEVEHNRLQRALQDSGIQLPPPPPTLVEDGATPTTSSEYRFDSPSQFVTRDKLAPKPPMTRAASGNDVRSPSGARERPDGASASAPLPSSPTPPVDFPPSSSATSVERNSSRDAAHSAARSFRVTMEDPCWRVLPAALKKYRINDDWKQYALFICYGNTERCLSYDEKPLILFQKLKESGQRPVFMLRHIRDIKSPIAVAQQKQAIKLGLPPNSTDNLLPTLENGSSTASGSGSGEAKEDGEPTPRESTFSDLPSPGSADKDKEKDKAPEGRDKEEGKEEKPESPPAKPKTPNAPGTLVDKDGNVHKVTYAVSIYPYIADRQDEFDVAVGAPFVVMSKAKGWWFVQKDPDGAGDVISDASKSAWVPAGCLLELTAPIASITPSTPGRIPGRASLPPNTIMSSSYPGVVLMEYQAKDTHELSIKEGDRVRVYKKYCHWSYSIKEDTGERGWVPAWFVGKLQGEGHSSSGPSTRKERVPNGTSTPDKRPSGTSPSMPSSSTDQSLSTSQSQGSVSSQLSAQSLPVPSETTPGPPPSAPLPPTPQGKEQATPVAPQPQQPPSQPPNSSSDPGHAKPDDEGEP